MSNENIFVRHFAEIAQRLSGDYNRIVSKEDYDDLELSMVGISVGYLIASLDCHKVMNQISIEDTGYILFLLPYDLRKYVSASLDKYSPFGF